MENNTLHMKLYSAASLLVIAAAFGFFSPSSAVAKVCFLPDCENDLGDINMDINNDTRWCEKKGYTYYSSGECPQYYKVTDTCKKDNHYLKCDANAWCKDNGYNTTSCSLPKFIDTQCPNGEPLYKSCKEDTARACKQLGYTNTCSGSQKLHASNGRCSWNNAYGTCCSPSGCPTYTSLTGTYGSSGSQDGCGYTCSYTCNMDCPSSYPYTSDPTGCSLRTTNGCGNKNCYQSKACCTPSCTNSTGCSCGTYTVSNGCGGTCTKCSSCCSSSSSNWCPVHSSCHTNCCTDGTIERCDPQCGGSGCGSSGGGSSGCTKYYTWQRGQVNGDGADYIYSVTCVCPDGTSRSLGTETIWDNCWRCDSAHLYCKANCGTSCYHSDPYYASSNNIINYGSRDVCQTFANGSC